MKQSAVAILTILTAGLGLSCSDHFAALSETNEFKKASSEHRSESKSQYEMSILANFSKLTNVPIKKIAIFSENLISSNSSITTDLRSHSELEFTNLSKPEFQSVKRYFEAAPNVKSLQSHVQYGGPEKTYSIIDFLMPAEQALVKHLFALQVEKVDDTEALVVNNCWAAAYELMRLYSGGQQQYTVFYPSEKIATEIFTNKDFFSELESFSFDETSTRLLTASPMDILLIYTGPSLTHVATIASAGIVFEKTSFLSTTFFRLANGSDVQKNWPTATTAKLMRATGKMLPEPHELIKTNETLPTYVEADGIPTYIGKIEPFVQSKTYPGRFELPVSSYLEQTFILKNN